MEIKFTGNSFKEVMEQMREAVRDFFVTEIPLAELPIETPAAVEPIRPVLTQAQMEENIATAPEHVAPPQPTLEDVRAVLKDLRDRKGAAAVKELLKAYGANSVPELKAEDYLGAIDRARAEA